MPVPPIRGKVQIGDVVISLDERPSPDAFLDVLIAMRGLHARVAKLELCIEELESWRKKGSPPS